MIKVKKPVGLIRYSSENEINGKKRKVLTLRSGIYILISLFFVSAFIYFLSASTNLQMVFLRGKTPFQVIESGKLIVNQFTLKLSHQGKQNFKVNFLIKDSEIKNKINVVTPVHPVVIDIPEKKVVVFFKFDPSILITGTRKVTVVVFDELTKKIVATKEVVLVGPTH